MNHLGKQFKRVYIEITNCCNLTCDFCPPTVRTPGFIDMNNFSHVLDEIVPYTDYVYLHVKGEPLLHPKLDTILTLCQDHNLKVNITTNGTLLCRTAPILYKSSALRQVNISLHSFKSNEGNQKFDSYIKDCLTSADYFSTHTNTITSLRLWNLDKNNFSIDLPYGNQAILAMIKEFFNLDAPIEDLMTNNRGIRIKERIYLNFDYEFTWPSLTAPFVSSVGTCHGLKDQIAILVDGTVIPCCLDNDGTVNLGNIYKESFSQILNKKRTLHMVEGFNNRILTESLCQHCGFRDRF